jgi:hypothetical protein
MLYALLVKGKALFFQVAAGRGQVGRGQCKMSVLAPPGFFHPFDLCTCKPCIRTFLGRVHSQLKQKLKFVCAFSSLCLIRTVHTYVHQFKIRSICHFSASQIRFAHRVRTQEFIARAREIDLPVLQNISVIANPQRLARVLFHQQHCNA